MSAPGALLLASPDEGKISKCSALHRMNPRAVRHRCAQLCDSEIEHSAVAAKTSTALWQRKRAQRCDSSGTDSAEITMCTLV